MLLPGKLISLHKRQGRHSHPALTWDAPSNCRGTVGLNAQSDADVHLENG